MTDRRESGRETWHRLLEWDQGDSGAERLAAQVLSLEGYESIDPQHPLGGPDGLKDIVCEYAGTRRVAAAYFPRGQQSLGTIREKVLSDAAGVAANAASAIAFVTNQELRLAERDELGKACAPTVLDLFHLERIAFVLNQPRAYGVRQEFLRISMTSDEQLAFMAVKDERLQVMTSRLESLEAQLATLGRASKVQLGFDLGIRTGGVVLRVWNATVNRTLRVRAIVEARRGGRDVPLPADVSGLPEETVTLHPTTRHEYSLPMDREHATKARADTSIVTPDVIVRARIVWDDDLGGSEQFPFAYWRLNVDDLTFSPIRKEREAEVAWMGSDVAL